MNLELDKKKFRKRKGQMKSYKFYSSPNFFNTLMFSIPCSFLNIQITN